MTSFVRLERPKPVEHFVSTMRFSREALGASFNAAWFAAQREVDAQDKMIYVQASAEWYGDVLGVEWMRGPAIAADPRKLHREAYGEGIGADIYSSVVLLTVDNALQQLGRALKLDKSRMLQGFGQLVNDVPLTKLIRATTNCVRHADEWDENPYLQVPYDKGSVDRAVQNAAQEHGAAFLKLDDQKELVRNARLALKSISVLQKVLGFGLHDRIHDAPTWHVLKLIDGTFLAGKYGTPEPDYTCFENAVLRAAREIVAQGDPGELSFFDDQFEQIGPEPATRS